MGSGLKHFLVASGQDGVTEPSSVWDLISEGLRVNRLRNLNREQLQMRSCYQATQGRLLLLYKLSFVVVLYIEGGVKRSEKEALECSFVVV